MFDKETETMLVTANLLRDGRTLSDDIQLKCTGHVYSVSEEYRDWFGPDVAVVAGPHLDFSSLGSHDVYTVELCSPHLITAAAPKHLPFFNACGLGWMHTTIHVV